MVENFQPDPFPLFKLFLGEGAEEEPREEDGRGLWKQGSNAVLKFFAGGFSFVAMSDRPPSLQHHRTDCRVGDWVLAASVPEWKTDRYVQFFKPSSHVRTVLFGSGSVSNDDSDNEWVFRGSYFIDPAGDPITIWRRES